METNIGVLPRNAWYLQVKIFKYILLDRLWIRSTFCAMMFSPGKSEQKSSTTSSFAIIVFCKTFSFINQIFFFTRHVFCKRIFSKEHPIGFRVFTCLVKNNIVRIAWSSHSQVLKNLLNGGKVYETHFLAIWRDI